MMAVLRYRLVGTGGPRPTHFQALVGFGPLWACVSVSIRRGYILGGERVMFPFQGNRRTGA